MFAERGSFLLASGMFAYDNEATAGGVLFCQSCNLLAT